MKINPQHNLPPAAVDVSVLLLFFNRPETFAPVFAEVRKARPARLFLYQDGPRGERDEAGVKACREIAEQVDWQCEVHRLYQTRNYGCDPSEFIAQKWAFSLTDKCIVLEDDDVPSQSFFPFCKELLDRYENDPRVWMIAGFNSEETTPVPGSYFFTQVFSIWGWASWRRVVDTWDEHYTWMDDSVRLEQMKQKVQQKHLRPDFLQMCADHKSSGKAFYETIFWASMLQHDACAIMSSQNQINNLGVLPGTSTHFAGSLETMPRRLRRQFTMPRHEISFPLVHPKEVEEYAPFQQAVYLRNAWNHPWRKVQYSLEELFLNLRYGNFGHITKAFRRRLRKWLGKDKHI